jgi:hypothetical protein
LGQLWAGAFADYNQRTGRPIVSPYDLNKEADLQLGNASDTAKLIGKKLGMAPATVEWLASSLQTNRWTIAKKWTDPVARQFLADISGRPMPPTPSAGTMQGPLATTLGLSRLVKPATTSAAARPTQEFEAKYLELQGQIASYRAYQQGKGLTDARTYAHEHFADSVASGDITASKDGKSLTLGPVMATTRKRIDYLRDVRDAVYAHPTGDPQKKREAIDELNAKIATVARIALKGR